MTLVDKELKSSKEESILHFKREYERLLATVIGRFSDDDIKVWFTYELTRRTVVEIIVL